MTRKPFRAAALSAANVQLNSNNFSTALVGSNAASANLSFTLPSSLGLVSQVITTDGSGNLFFSNVSGGSFSVALANASNVLSNVITSISTIAFDTDSGFDIVDLGNNAVKVQMNSTFKFWEVEGQDTIIAEGLDTINIAAGDGIALSTNAASKTLTIAAIPEEQGDTLDDQFTVSSSNVFTLSQSVSSANNIIVSLSGIVQSPDTHYSVSGTSLIFNNSAPLTQNVHVGVRYLQVIRSSSTVTVGSGINFVDAFIVSGNSNVFTLSSNVTAESDLLVLLDGVLQATTSYTIDTNQLTLANVIPLSTGSLEVRGISSITSNVDAVINTSFAVDGSTNAFTLPSVPSSAEGILVSIDGLVQHPDTYSVSGTTLTLANTAPLPTSKLAVRSLGSGSSVGSDSSAIDTVSANVDILSASLNTVSSNLNTLETTVSALGGAALGSVANNTLDLSTGNFFEVTTNDQTLTFSNPPDVHEFKIKLTGDGTVSNYILNAASFDAFGVGSEDTAPEGLFFKPDGSKMYIVGDTGDDVNEYDLSTPWDVSSASYLQNFSVSAQEATPTDIFFKPDGSKMYIVGITGDDVNEYDLSTPWDISTASFLHLFSVAAQETNPVGISFKPDGSKMYIVGNTGDDVNEYNLSTPWDVSSASFLQTFSVVAQEIVPQALFFKPDGAKMYIVGSSSDTVYQYSLSTAWDVSSASYDSVGLNVSSVDLVPKGIFFKEDGSTLYVLGAGTKTVYAYSLSTVYDVNSASFNSKFFSVGSEESTPTDLFFKPDGTKMYIVGSVGDEVNEYDLSIAWDVSTAAFLQLFSVAAQEANPEGLFFKPDGSKMYIIGASGDDVNEYDLSTPWDVSTSVFLQSFSANAQETAPQGLFFKPDGSKMYIVGSTGDEVNEYDLSTPWDVSTASFLQLFSLVTQDNTPRGLFFKPDGSKMYIAGGGSSTVYQYSLSTAWDVSSASYDAISFYVSLDISIEGLAFDSEGTRMYVLGSGSDRVYQYDVTATTLATITYPASVKFSGATPPAVPAIGEVDTLEFYTVDSGTTYYAYQLGDAHG